MSLINKNILTDITESKIQDTFQDFGGKQELPSFEIMDVEGCLTSLDMPYTP